MADLHDSQAAMPLMQKTAEACPAFYRLLDAGYDAAPIRDYSRSIGSVPMRPRQPAAQGGRAESPNSNPQEAPPRLIFYNIVV